MNNWRLDECVTTALDKKFICKLFDVRKSMGSAWYFSLQTNWKNKCSEIGPSR